MTMRNLDEYNCGRGQEMETDQWLAAHKPHGEPEKVPNQHQPPRGTYTLYTLSCQCGAQHIISEVSDEQ